MPGLVLPAGYACGCNAMLDALLPSNDVGKNTADTTQLVNVAAVTVV